MASSQIAAFVTSLTDIDTTARDQLGAIRADLNARYKYVQFGASRTTNVTASLAAGDIVCYVGLNTADLDKLTLVDSANSAVGAGMVLGTIAATGGPFFGWIQIQGVATLDQTMAGSPSAGDVLTTAAAAAKLMTKRVTDNAMECAVLVDNTTATAPVVALRFPN